MALLLEPNIEDADGVYEQLVSLHEGRSDEDSARVNARLILILINHIGDRGVIAEALRLAGASGSGSSSSDDAATARRSADLLP